MAGMSTQPLDRESPRGTLEVAALLGLDDGTGGGKKLLCRACGQVVTTTSARVEVAGAHEHTKRNPAGFVFRIGCFRAAPGCLSWGDACADHTWFAGYAWQLALCRRCGSHLGWAFEGEGAPFHGLVLAWLREEDEGPAT
jgi:hypothetical protein